MSVKTFDPYHVWLGIPPREQPPHHYRLLGIQLFEEQPDVIDAASTRQTTYLQAMASGEHRRESQQLLNEVAAARRCLLDSQRKAAYDAKLRAELAQPAEDAAAAEETAPAFPFLIDTEPAAATPPPARGPRAAKSREDEPARDKPAKAKPAKESQAQDKAAPKAKSKLLGAGIWSLAGLLLLCLAVAWYKHNHKQTVRPSVKAIEEIEQEEGTYEGSPFFNVNPESFPGPNQSSDNK